MTCTRFMPVTPLVTNRFRPTGGVTMPISMFTTMITPRWIGSMPSSVAMGNRIGARIRMMPVGSMKLPAISRMMLTTSRNIQGDMPTARMCSAIVCGMRSVVSTWANSRALATMNISITVVLADSRNTSGMSLTLRSR
ncbi:hypothetical protein D9M68_870350 [compost metagenome]